MEMQSPSWKVLPPRVELLILLVHVDIAAAGNTAGAHATGHNGSVRGHTAADGQDALSGLHAGRYPRERSPAGPGPPSRHESAQASASSAVEDDFAAGGSGGSAQATCQWAVFSFRASVSNWGCSRVSRFRGSIMATAFFSVDHALVHQIAGDLQSSRGGTLAVTGLEHIELAVLHGELHVLHIPVVVLQQGGRPSANWS